MTPDKIAPRHGAHQPAGPALLAGGMTMRDLARERAGWRAYADRLAEWVHAHLANRDDVWGAYVPPTRRASPDRKSFTAPPLARRGLDRLDVPTLARHFRGDDVLGLHTTGRDITSRWVAFDFDAHGGTEAEREANERAAARLCREIRHAGAEPIVEDSDGRGGLHVWIIFDAPVPTPNVYAFGQGLIWRADIAAPEQFPKQPRPDPGRYGNWLRLPGRHHTLPHWSRVLVGETWVCGADAARAILAHRIAPASIVPPAPAVPPAPPVPMPSIAPRAPVTSLERYVAKVETGLSDGRKRRAFAFAAALWHDFQLAPAGVTALLDAWNRENRPPLGDALLAEIVTNARRYGGHHHRGAA